MDVISYKCPNCAAAVEFDIQHQDWHCRFCDSRFTLAQLKALQPQEQPQPLRPEQPQPEEQAYGEDAVSYSCPSCGGRIITDGATAATFCVYCHNPAVIQSRLAGERRPVALVPFAMQKQDALAALNKLCRRKPLLPRPFKDSISNSEISGLYVPFWLFSSEMDTLLQANAQKTTTWHSGNYRYTKTDYYSVARGASIAYSRVPENGSAKMDDNLMRSLEPYDYRGLMNFSMQYLSGHYAEGYDVKLSDVAERALKRIASSAQQLTRGLVRGYSTVQVTSCTANPRGTMHEYVMLPVWMLRYQYEGKDYYFAMNGQTGKITGKLPMSVLRLLIWFSAIFAAASGLFLLGGLLL